MASVASQLIQEVTAHAQRDSLEDAREICADGTYFPNNLRIKRNAVPLIMLTSRTRPSCFFVQTDSTCTDIQGCEKKEWWVTENKNTFQTIIVLINLTVFLKVFSCDCDFACGPLPTSRHKHKHTQKHKYRHTTHSKTQIQTHNTTPVKEVVGIKYTLWSFMYSDWGFS